MNSNRVTPKRVKKKRNKNAACETHTWVHGSKHTLSISSNIPIKEVEDSSSIVHASQAISLIKEAEDSSSVVQAHQATSL